MRKLLISLLLFTNYSLLVPAQTSTSKFSVSGRITDYKTHQPIDGASVRLLKEGIKTYVDGTITSKDGIFTLKNISIGNYLLQINYLGYTNVTRILRVQGSLKPNIDFGEITLEESSTTLKETVVIGHVAEMVVKRDTIEYNPRAYKLQPGTVVEDLLKRMSGVEIDTEGKITVAGKEVKKIFIDGKQYFGNDPTVASKNIPIEIIEKLQVIDKKSDLAQLTGIDDGEEETVINLTIKKGMKKGWIINSKAGIGKESNQLDGDTRYEANTMVNRFFGDSQISLIANTNNVNIKPSRDWGTTNNAAMGMRSGRTTSAGNGITISNAYGANFAFAPSNKLKYGGNILYNQQRTNAGRRSIQNPLLDSIPVSNSESTSYLKSENLSTDLKFEYHPDSALSVIFTPTIRINRSTSNSSNETSSFLGIKKSPINRSKSSPIANSQGLNLNGRFDVSYLLNKKGRRLSFSVETGLNNNDGNGYNLSETYFYSTNKDSILNQNILNKSETFNYRLYGAYVEPFGTNNFLQFSYSYRSNHSISDKMTYKLDRNNQYSNLDSAYSKSLDNEFINQQIGISIRSIREKFNYTIGIDVEPSYTNSKRYIGDKIINSLNGRSVVNLAPNLNYTYRFNNEKNIRIDYRGKTNQPSISQLDPTPDISNPLNIRLGNPDLLPSYSNNFTLRYSKQIKKTQESIIASLFSNYTFNDIISRSSFDSLGVQKTSYINESGNWSVGGMNMLNMPIGKGAFQFNSFSNGLYNSKIGYTSSQRKSLRNVANTLRLSQSLGISYRGSIIYTLLRGNYSFNQTTNSLSINKGQKNITFGGTLTTQITLPMKFILSSDIRYTANRGLSANLNKDETLWNAELSKLLFKKQNGTLSIKAYDLLHQQLNISRNVTNNYLEDVQYNTLTSYFLVSFAYRFNSFGGRGMHSLDGSTNPYDRKRKYDRSGRAPEGGFRP